MAGIYYLGFSAGCCSGLTAVACLLLVLALAGLIGIAGLWAYQKIKGPGTGQ